MGRRIVRVERPKFWFSKTSDKWPEWAELAIELPAALVEEHGGDADAARAELAAEVERQEQKAHAEMRAAGRTYLGAKRAMKVPFTARASSYEEFGALDPTFAAEKGEEARQAAREHKQFLADYAAALKEWRAGNRDVVFPHGTWLVAHARAPWRAVSGAAVAPAQSPLACLRHARARIGPSVVRERPSRRAERGAVAVTSEDDRRLQRPIVLAQGGAMTATRPGTALPPHPREQATSVGSSVSARRAPC